MSKKKTKSHARAVGMTQISISLPERLVNKVDRLAELDNRSRSNFITHILEQLRDTDENILEHPAAHLKAAEPRKLFMDTEEEKSS